MKLKFFLFMLLAVFAISANAQYKQFVFDNTTVTNGGTSTAELKLPSTNVTSFDVLITRTSGTLAGNIYVYGKVKNTYIPLDTIAVTNGATFGANIILGRPDYYTYKIVYTGSGTMVGTIQAHALIRP